MPPSKNKKDIPLQTISYRHYLLFSFLLFSSFPPFPLFSSPLGEKIDVNCGSLGLDGREGKSEGREVVRWGGGGAYKHECQQVGAMT